MSKSALVIISSTVIRLQVRDRRPAAPCVLTVSPSTPAAAPAVQTVLLQEPSAALLRPAAPVHLQLRLQSDGKPWLATHTSVAVIREEISALTLTEKSH
ncbi:hypothetical protein DPX16_4529 [Anabarilius grahami]|uniref:Uncharacterized protein n=1 Tax=Anabarilius grahami TaxID=495550 RepID=A0A3N0XHE7_ANAGA|nr:hypothetical protein DPX16_4529 [Anabarilius grahami]